MWILFKKQYMSCKPVFAENDQDLFILACMNFIMNEIRSIDDEDKYVSPCYYAKYWNKLHLQIIWYGREYCKARDCYGITCKICKSCYPNRKKPIKVKKA